MADNPRIDDLKRRVQKDPASIAFAQLAEEYRRGGQCQESVEVCRAGLSVHPGYLSARVTLGRALLELGTFDEARTEFELVLKSAPDNLAAVRGLAETFHKQGALEEALKQYESALALARNDPDLEQTVKDLARELGPRESREPEGLSLEQMHIELAARIPLPPPAARPSPVAPDRQASAALPQQTIPQPSTLGTSAAPAGQLLVVDPARERSLRQVAALDEWVDAIHAARANRVS
jgi:tetratricopeptide (TPR) repeat protein